MAQAAFSATLLGLPVLAPAFRDEFGLSLSEVGIVLASFWIGPTVTLLPWGLVADRIGERWVLAGGIALCGVGVLAAAFASALVPLVLLLILAGAAGASVNAASGRAVMSWFGAEERGLALGVRQTALPLGGVISALALPPIEAAVGLDGALVFLSGFCLASAVVGAALVRDAGHADELEDEVRSVLRDGRLWRLCLASAFYLVPQVALTSFFVLFLHDERGLSTGRAAGILAVVQVTAIGLRIGLGRWSDVLRRRVAPLRLVGLAIVGAGLLTALLVDAPLALLIPSLGLAAALSMAWNGLSFTAAAEIAGRARSGGAIGLQQTVLSIAGAAAPAPFAALVDASSWRAGYALAVLLPLCGWVLLARLADR